MKTILVVLVSLMLVSCTKDIDLLPSLTTSRTSRNSSLAAIMGGFSTTIKIYSDNGKTQFSLDSINLYVGSNVRDTANPVNEYVNNDLAFVRNGQELYSVGLKSIIDSIPFIIKNPTLSYYTMKVTVNNVVPGLYLYDGAGVVIDKDDITPTYIGLVEGETKYSFSSQKDFGVSLSKRFALIYKP